MKIRILMVWCLICIVGFGGCVLKESSSENTSATSTASKGSDVSSNKATPSRSASSDSSKSSLRFNNPGAGYLKKIPASQTFEQLSKAGKIEEVVPLMESFSYWNSNITEEFKACSMYKADGKWGLVDKDGIIRVSHENDLETCFACLVVNKDHKIVDNNFEIAGEVMGHGGLGVDPHCYDLTAKKIPQAGEGAYYAGEGRSISDFDGEEGEFYVFDIVEMPPGFFIDASAAYSEEEIKFTGKKMIAYKNAFITGPDVTESRYQVKFKNGKDVMAIKQNDRWKFIGTDGKAVFSSTYEDVRNFYSGYCPVKQGGKWGYIDEKGNAVSDFIYDEARIIINDKAFVKKDGLWKVERVLI